MAQEYRITTTGTQTPIILNDLGRRIFTHPTTDFDLIPEFTMDELLNSDDLQTAITDGHITVEDASGNPITEDSVPIVAGSGFEDTIVLKGGRKKDSTNRYLESDGQALNKTPHILPWDCTMISITAATDGNETWDAEVHSGESLVTGAFLSLSSESSGFASDFSIDFSAGDPVEFYVNGNHVKGARMTCIFRRR